MSRLRDAWNGLIGRGPSTTLTRQIRREWVVIQLDIEQQLSQMHRLVQRLAQREKRATATSVEAPPAPLQADLDLGPALNGRLALKDRKAALRARRSGLTDARRLLPSRTPAESEEPPDVDVDQTSEISG